MEAWSTSKIATGIRLVHRIVAGVAEGLPCLGNQRVDGQKLSRRRVVVAVDCGVYCGPPNRVGTLGEGRRDGTLTSSRVDLGVQSGDSHVKPTMRTELPTRVTLPNLLAICIADHQ